MYKGLCWVRDLGLVNVQIYRIIFLYNCIFVDRVLARYEYGDETDPQ